MNFFYSDLDLSEFDLFKVVKGDRLMDEEDTSDQEVTILVEGENAPSSKATPKQEEERVQEEKELTPPWT